MNTTTLGEFLAKKRKAANLTQAALSKLLTSYNQHYAATTISGWENGSNLPVDNPDFVSVLALALGISEVEIYQAAGIFSPSSNVALHKLLQLLETATPSEREQIEQFAKFLISNRKRSSE